MGFSLNVQKDLARCKITAVEMSVTNGRQVFISYVKVKDAPVDYHKCLLMFCANITNCKRHKLKESCNNCLALFTWVDIEQHSIPGGVTRPI